MVVIHTFADLQNLKTDYQWPNDAREMFLSHMSRHTNRHHIVVKSFILKSSIQ
jgi:hypothetical protein